MTITHVRLEHASATLSIPTSQGKKVVGDLIPGESASQITPDSLLPVGPSAKRLNCDLPVLIDALEGRDSFIEMEFVAAMCQRTTEAIRIRVTKRQEYVPAVNMPHVRLYRWSKNWAPASRPIKRP